MKPLVGRGLVAIVLFAGAAVAARESGRLRSDADMHERLATLRYAEVDDSVGGYWRGEYEQLQHAGLTAAGDDPETTLFRANGAFRASQRRQQSRQDQVQQLEAVLQAYAEALKSSTFLPDAAYNYEYVARLRDGVSRPPSLPRHSASYGGTGPRAAPLAPAPAAASAGDLPGGATIHGRPGGPPPGTKGEEFEILTPMEYGDRETQPQPTPGGKPLRKGE